MAWLIRPLRKTLTSPSLKALLPLHQHPKPTSLFTSRNYISDMRKSAFQANILRLLRKEIQYEHERCPPKQPVTRFNSFTIDDRAGEQWIRLRRKFGEKEDITIEATLFDGSLPVSNPGKVGDDVQLHITFIVNISKGDDSNVLEIMCSAWPDALEIQKLFVRGNNRTPDQPYFGPQFKELDDELQDSLYEFLEERSVNDELAVFLHEYMKIKDKTEFIKWLETVKSYIGKK
ncbi:uncharacterized protein At2g39795, mitochondrial-like isoform X2 [Durio zibethinus]|uniref:Uncharacterized protein At2g39795, mitochondrial-like isoform X2 n=1 Tax=Durio zibethinus TaxID=66656 RepID=A0A6P5X6R1_DURZI|nr:uncharacterized protein At2g39795, mitochondrial-like isoform X2 [Durio zibethinus]